MIKNLSVTNFQSHKHSSLDFGPGINVIVGSSDAGKSALLRAIRWLIFNRPLGVSIIRQGEEQCYVKLETDKGTVERSKGRNGKGPENYYKVVRETYRSFGSDTPDTISSVVNIGDINMLGQFDGYYLVFESSGEIAKELNKALDISLIDKCVYVCNSSIRDYNLQVKSITKQRERLENELCKYKGLDALEKKINEWSETRNRLDGLIDKANKLEQLIRDINKVKFALTRASINTEAIELEINELDDLILNYLDKSERYTKLHTLCQEIKRVNWMIVSAEHNVKCSIDSMELKKKEYESALSKFNICPFCNRKMTQSVCEHLVRRLE